MEIIICTNCKGKGVTVRDQDFGYYSDYIKEECSECGGTGRITSLTFKLIAPFSRPIEDIYEIETKIIRLIREFKSGN